MSLSKKWTDTVDRAINDSRWDEYDKLIQDEIAAYDKRFPKTACNVDWQLIRAMLWSESGGPDNASWKTRPLHIGNPGDKGYDVLKNEKEASGIIMSDTLKYKIKTQSISSPKLNIQAGIAYLYTKMSISSKFSTRDLTDTKFYYYTVKSGDSLDKIAKKVGTTVMELRRLNPKASGVIQPKQTLKYVKASIKRNITGWRVFNTAMIAKRYNGGGDAKYEEKLDYVMTKVIPKLVRI